MTHPAYLLQRSLFLLLLLSGIALSRDTRAIRIIRRYDNHTCLEEKRQTSLNVASATDNDVAHTYPNIKDTARFNETGMRVRAAFTSSRDQGTFAGERSQRHTAGIALDKDDQKYQLKSPWYFLDTTAYTIALSGRSRLHTTTRIMEKRDIPPVFAGITAEGSCGLSQHEKKGYDRDLAAINNDSINDLKSDWIVTNQQNLDLRILIQGSLGLGRQVRVTPAYQSLMLEQRLRKNGAARAALSDETMQRLAALLAQHASYCRLAPSQLPIFKAALDSVLIQDSSVTKESLRFVSPLDAAKLLLRSAPLFMSKPCVRLYTTGGMFGNFYRKENCYPFDVYDLYTDTSYYRFSFRYAQLLGLDFSWGAPLSSAWFFDVYAVKHLLATNQKQAYYHHGAVNWDEVLDIRWDARSSWWLSDSFILRLGVANLSSWIVAPRELPYASYLDATLLVEEYLSLTAAVSYYSRKEHHAAYQKWREPRERPFSGLVISLGAVYNL